MHMFSFIVFYVGNIILKATDGHFWGNELVLPLHVSSVFPPAIEQIQDIVLTEGSSLVLNTSFLSIYDPDNVNDVTFKIIDGK